MPILQDSRIFKAKMHACRSLESWTVGSYFARGRGGGGGGGKHYPHSLSSDTQLSYNYVALAGPVEIPQLVFAT